MKTILKTSGGRFLKDQGEENKSTEQEFESDPFIDTKNYTADY